MNVRLKSQDLLLVIQKLYQQNIISQADKNRITKSISLSIKNNEFSETIRCLKNTQCLKEDKRNLIAQALDIVEGGN